MMPGYLTGFQVERTESTPLIPSPAGVVAEVFYSAPEPGRMVEKGASLSWLATDLGSSVGVAADAGRFPVHTSGREVTDDAIRTQRRTPTIRQLAGVR